MHEEKLVDENERIRIDAINKVKHIQSLDTEKQLLMRISEDPKTKENYEVFKTQCSINELLNKLVKFIKRNNISGNEFKINQVQPFRDFVSEEDFINFTKENIIPKINTEVIDINNIDQVEAKEKRIIQTAITLYDCNIEELRGFLYYCNSIKPVPMPKLDFNINLNVIKCYAAGVNPGAIFEDSDNWFMEEKDYRYILNNDLREILINGTIFNEPIAVKESIENKKNTSFH